MFQELLGYIPSGSEHLNLFPVFWGGTAGQILFPEFIMANREEISYDTVLMVSFPVRENNIPVCEVKLTHIFPALFLTFSLILDSAN